MFFFFQAEDGIRDIGVTGVQTCALPISTRRVWREAAAIVGRYPAATVIPGAVLGAIAEAPHYFAGERLIIGNVLTYMTARSEESRVGKECRSRWSPYQSKKKTQ